MPVEVPLTQLLAQLQQIRATHGDQAYNDAVRSVALSLVGTPRGEEFVKQAFPELDLEELKSQAAEEKKVVQQAVPTGNPDELLMQVLRQQMPGLKSQGHFNIFMSAFDALRSSLNAYFANDQEGGKKSRDALNKALDMASQVHIITEQAAEVENPSEKLREFMEPAKQLHEYDDQKTLLSQVGKQETLAQLTEWYASNRGAIDRIVSQSLRNELFDAIRAHKNTLKAKESN